MVPISLKDEEVSIPLLEDNCVKVLKYNGLDDLEYGITSSGLKETIVIKEKREEYGFSFLVKMTTVKLTIKNSLFFQHSPSSYFLHICCFFIDVLVFI